MKAHVYTFIGNLQCEGETAFAQKEFCHYRRHEMCGPHARLILDRLNISVSPGSGLGEDGLCTCKFRGGQRVCDDSECYILYSEISLIWTLLREMKVS